MAAARPTTFDHLKSSKKPLRRTVPIYTDDEAVEAYETVAQELASARARAQALKLEKAPEEAELLVQLEAAQKVLDKSTIKMVFESIGRKKYDALVDEFPPDDEDIAEHRKEHGENSTPPYSADPFSVALIAASCVQPQMTREQVKEIQRDWNTAEYVELFIAALSVNTQRRVVEAGKGFG